MATKRLPPRRVDGTFRRRHRRANPKRKAAPKRLTESQHYALSAIYGPDWATKLREPYLSAAVRSIRESPTARFPRRKNPASAARRAASIALTRAELAYKMASRALDKPGRPTAAVASRVEAAYNRLHAARVRAANAGVRLS
jgi:hypothetical protein